MNTAFLVQDYDKYGVHSSEDKSKLFRLVKAENQGRSRITADGIGLLRAEVERQGKQQPARRQSTVFNSKPYAAHAAEARPAEKVQYSHPYKIHYDARHSKGAGGSSA